jgi:hypothetical protein
MLLNWMATSVIRPYKVKWIVWETLTLNGLVFSALAFPWIHIDLTQMIRSPWIKFAFWVLYFRILWAGLFVLATPAAVFHGTVAGQAVSQARQPTHSAV